MRVIFVYTNELSPGVSVVSNVVKIETVTVDDVEKIRVTDNNSATYDFVKVNGNMAIMWE